jgi:hypothetical protein
MLLAWKKAKIITYAGYILGFPADTSESIRTDIEIIKRELPVDILEFFCLTPLPGSEDHLVNVRKGVEMDSDMNKYDLEHVVVDHPKMTRAEWETIYRSAWESFYTRDHLMTILRRGAGTGMGLSRLMAVLFFFSACLRIEGVHPLQGGLFRLKHRRDRRYGLPIEPVWSFYPKLMWEILSKHVRAVQHWIEIESMARRARRDQRVRPDTDIALTPVTDEDTGTLEIFTHNEGARAEVERRRRIAALTNVPMTG